MPPIDFEYACSQCPEVVELHSRKNDSYEYGLNWYEFVYTEWEDIHGLVEKWWENLDSERKKELINKEIESLTEKLESLKSYKI